MTEHKGNCSWLTDGDDRCTCDDCSKSREDFSAWCDAFNQRWAERKAARHQDDEDMSDPAYNAHPAAMGSVDYARLGTGVRS